MRKVKACSQQHRPIRAWLRRRRAPLSNLSKKCAGYCSVDLRLAVVAVCFLIAGERSYAQVSDAVRLFVSRQQLAESIQQSRQQEAWEAAASSFASKSTTDGSLSIIVELELPATIPVERVVSDPDSAARQNQMVQEAQDRFAVAVSDIVAQKSIMRFQGLPFVRVDAQANLVNRIFSLPFVRSIGEEGMGVPMLNQSIPQIGADLAYNQGATGSNQVVAIIDLGVEHTNPMFNGKVVAQACYASADADTGINSWCTANGQTLGYPYGSTVVGSGDPCTFDNISCSHGTEMAGIAAGASTANGPNGVTIRGVATLASVISTMVVSKSTDNASHTICANLGLPSPCAPFRESDVVNALNYVYSLRNSYRIASVNMSFALTAKSASWSTTTCDSSWPLSVAAVNQLAASNIGVVAASGNFGPDNTTLSAFYGKMGPPACFSKAVSVGAVAKPNQGGGFAGYSNANAQLSLLAPGGECYPTATQYCSIWSALPYWVQPTGFNNVLPGNKYTYGTSEAAAHVTGAIAALRTVFPFTTPSGLATQLKNTGASVSVPAQGSYPGGTKPRIVLNQALTGPAAPSVPQNVTVTNEHCHGSNSVDFNPPASGTTTEYHVAGSTSSQFTNPILFYAGTGTSIVVQVTQSMYIGVQACNLVSCSAWALGQTQATYYNGCQ